MPHLNFMPHCHTLLLKALPFFTKDSHRRREGIMTPSCKVYFSILVAGLSLASCTLPDICEEDADGDGITNCIDVCPNHFDPSILDEKVLKNRGCPTDPDLACQDSDADGIIDCLDPCPDHADLEPTECGCGIEPSGEGAYMMCPEGYGIEDLCPNDPQKKDPGVCGCGIPDNDIHWEYTYQEDTYQMIGKPESTCPESDLAPDRCPFDPDKKEPGKCGCGIPDIDSDGDTILDCNEQCPNDPDKQIPGKCGCDIPDSPENLKDGDGDGVVNCLDLCPDNPYKVEPGNTGCEHSDTDGDDLEDQDDFCPYNPNIQTAADLENSETYLSCNIQLDKKNNKLIYEVWTPQDLLTANAAFGAFIEHINVSDDEKADITSQLQLGAQCDAAPKPSCFNLDMTNYSDNNNAQYVCESYAGTMRILGYRRCSYCDFIFDGSGNTEACDEPFGLFFQKPSAMPPSEDKRFVIRLMNDINVYYHLIHQNTFGVANWQGISLHDVELDGNDKKLISQDLEHQPYSLNAPVFKDLINTYVHKLTIDISYQGTGSGTLAQNTTRSIIENVHVNTSMMIQDSIFGDSNNQTSSGFVNYAKDSIFRDIHINMAQLHTIAPTNFSGFSGIADNVELSNIHITFGGITCLQSGNFSGVFGSIYANDGNNTVNELYLNFNNTSTFNKANVAGIANSGGNTSFHNISMKIDDFNLRTGGFYSLVDSGWNISIDNAYFDIKNIYTEYEFAALRDIKNASNVWMHYGKIVTDRPSILTDIERMDHVYLNIDAIDLSWATTNSCADMHGDPRQECLTRMPLVENTSLDHFELNIGKTNLSRINIDARTLSHGNIHIMASKMDRSPDPLNLQLSMTIDNLDHVSLFTNAHVDLYRDELQSVEIPHIVYVNYPQTYLGEINQFVVTQPNAQYYENLQKVDVSSSPYCQSSCSPNYQKYENIVYACLQKENTNVTWDLRTDPQTECAKAYFSDTISCYYDKIIENIYCDDIENKCSEMSSYEEEEACMEDYYACRGYFDTYYDPKMGTIEDCLDDAISTYSEYLDSFVNVCSEIFNTQCDTYLTIKDAYWYRHHDDASAFVASDLAELCLNDLWTPFVDADTAGIVERLSDGWKAEKIGDRVIPWYTPDTTWIDTLKSTLGVTE